MYVCIHSTPDHFSRLSVGIGGQGPLYLLPNICNQLSDMIHFIIIILLIILSLFLSHVYLHLMGEKLTHKLCTLDTAGLCEEYSNTK